MDAMQIQFQSVAESHLQLSDHLRENVAVPLGKLLNKQRILRKEVSVATHKIKLTAVTNSFDSYKHLFKNYITIGKSKYTLFVEHTNVIILKLKKQIY